MECPFLNEAEVRSCGVSPFRKMLMNSDRSPKEEKCTSGDFARCPMMEGRPEAHQAARLCPFLEVALVQYCGAATATHFIPYSETLLSCCQSEGHRYCELFLNQAEPERDSRMAVGGIDLPVDLSFSENHMWMDVSEDGSCHVGADAFLASVIGSVEKVSFIAPKNVCRPTAVLRVCGVDLTLVFPKSVNVGRSNVHLKADPHRIVTDPYGLGWLFEGRVPAETFGDANEGTGTHLKRGQEAIGWMKGETERMTRFVHETLSQPRSGGEMVLNDGGNFAVPVIPNLQPEDRMLLFSMFFSLDATRRPR